MIDAVLFVTALLCVGAGTVVFGLMLWLARRRGTRGGLLHGWGMLVWTAALVAAVALVLYGALLWTNGAYPTATLSVVFAFVIAFEFALAAAARFLLPSDSIHLSSGAAVVQVGLALFLFIYLVLINYWDMGSLLAALTPLIVVLVSLLLVLVRWHRDRKHATHTASYRSGTAAMLMPLGLTEGTTHTPGGPAAVSGSHLPSRAANVVFAVLLLLTALGFALGWLLCTEADAHAILWPFLLLLLGGNLSWRLRDQARGRHYE